MRAVGRLTSKPIVSYPLFACLALLTAVRNSAQFTESRSPCICHRQRACFPQRPPIPFGRRFKPKQIVHLFSRFKAIHSRPSVRVTVVHSSQKLLPTTFLDCMTTCFVKPSRGQSSRMYNCYLADQKSGLFGFKQRVQERRGGLGK